MLFEYRFTLYICRNWKANHLWTEILSCIGRESSVGIATCYGLDGLGIESRREARFSAPFQTGPGAYAASYTMGTGGKAAGGGFDRPPHLTQRLRKE